MHRPPRFSHLPFFWWWNWLWFHISAHGASVGWLWKEVQTGILHLPGTSDCHSCSGTIQLHSYHSHHLGTFWLRLHGGQWGHLWYLPSKFGYREAILHQSQSFDWSNCVLHHCVTAFRWCTKCWLDWVSGTCQSIAFIFAIWKVPVYFAINCLKPEWIQLFMHISFPSTIYFIADQLGALSTDSFPIGYLCSCHLCRESLPWTAYSCWNHQCLLWAS